MRPQLRSGARVAGFRVEKMLGAGSTGTVYLVRDDGTGGPVALKVLSPELARDDRFRQRFLRESEIAAGLDHPGIIKTVAAGEADDLLYLAMEFVAGVDLRELLREEGRLEPRRAVELVVQVAAALDAAHAAGLVHRDVKPGNILVALEEDAERAYLCDFGLARHVSSVSSLTGERGFVGTVDYVPPEQIQGAPLDGRADLYSLGCVLFECLTGVRPFEADSELSVVYAHLNEPPPRVSDVRPEVPAAFDDVVATALAKAPADRYATCGELADAAEAALQGTPLRRRRPAARRRVLLLVTGLVLVAGGAAVLIAARGGGPPRTGAVPPLALRPNALNVVDVANHRVIGRTVLANRSLYGSEPADLAFAGGAAWALIPGEQRLARVDPRTRRILGSVHLPFRPGARLATGEGVLWVTEDEGPRVVGVEPRRAKIVRRFTVPGTNTGGIVYGGRSLWVAQGDNVARVDPRSGRVLTRVRNPGQPGGTVWLAYGDGALWSARGDGVVRKIDPVAGRILWTAHIDGWLSDIVVGDGAVWLPKVPEGIVYRLSEDDLTVLAPLAGGADPERAVLAGRALWLANGSARTLTRLDLDSGVRRTIRLSAEPSLVAFRKGVLWTGAKPSPRPLPPVAGPELRLTGGLNPDPVFDGSVADDQALYARCVHLVAYPDLPGAAGTRLRPEVAVAMPAVSLGGRRYTFRIRRGFRFSPPSNQPVTAETFRSSAERALSPGGDIRSPGSMTFAGLAGAAAFHAGRVPHVHGIAVHGDTVSFTLVKPAGDFLERLAGGAACPVPIGTPLQSHDAQKPVPSAGPYYLSSVEGGRTVLLRNPNYHGRRPRRPARIVYDDNVQTPKAAALANDGVLDYVHASDPPLQLGGPLERAFGAASAAARQGKQRYYRLPMPWEDGLVLNAARPLFSDVRLRRALNFALDRRALARAFNDDPSDEIVPSAVTGFRAGSVYPLTPDLATARRLAGTQTRHALLWYCVNGVFGSPAQGRIAQLIRSQLARIRLDVAIERSNCEQDFRYDRTSRSADLIMFSSGSSERDAASFFSWILDGRSYGAALGRGMWSTPSFRRQVARAAAVRGPTRTRAYSALVGRLMRAAPYAMYGSFVDTEYFSPRVRCKVFQRALGFVDLGALCVPRKP
jgi:serine/threonine-protein kinase